MLKYEAIHMLDVAQAKLDEAIDLVSQVFGGDGNVQAYWIDQAKNLSHGINPYDLNIEKLKEKVVEGRCYNVDDISNGYIGEEDEEM